MLSGPFLVSRAPFSNAVPKPKKPPKAHKNQKSAIFGFCVGRSMPASRNRKTAIWDFCVAQNTPASAGYQDPDARAHHDPDDSDAHGHRGFLESVPLALLSQISKDPGPDAVIRCFSWNRPARDWEAHRRAIGTKFPPPTLGPPASDLVLFALKGKQDQVRRGGL